MKKLTLVLGVFASTIFAVNAQVACTIDSTLIPQGRMSYPDTLPCVVQGEAYEQTVQFRIPGTVDASQFGIPLPLTFTIDSIVVDSVSGFPQGISAQWNPASGVFYGGTFGCFHIAGTTNDPAGSYPVTMYGTATVSGLPTQFVPSGDTTVSLQQMQALGANPFNLSLDVIEPGQECRPLPSGISALNSFNAIINVFPNPAKSVLNVNINTVDRINGSISIVDMLGRVVYTEKVDYLGLVNKQINVANFGKGIYSLQITNNKNAYKTKFIVE